MFKTDITSIVRIGLTGCQNFEGKPLTMVTTACRLSQGWCQDLPARDQAPIRGTSIPKPWWMRQVAKRITPTFRHKFDVLLKKNWKLFVFIKKSWKFGVLIEESALLKSQTKKFIRATGRHQELNTLSYPLKLHEKN